MDRRNFLRLGAGASVGLSNLLQSPLSFAVGDPASLTVMTWGGGYANVLRTHVDAKFEKLYGTKILQDFSNPAERIAKLKVNLDQQTYDVIQLPPDLVPLAVSQDVLASLDRSSPNLTNVADVYPNLVNDHWVAQMFSAFGLTYNEKLVKKPPTSFADLWDPEYKGRIVLPDISHSFGPYVVCLGAIIQGKDPKDADAGFAKLTELNQLDPIWQNNTDAILNAFRSEEAVIGVMYRSQTYTLIDKGTPVRWIYPKEGAIPVVWGTSIAKTTKYLATAEEYSNLILDPEVQTQFAHWANYTPSNRKAIDLLPVELQQRVKYTDAEVASLIQLDHQFMSDHRGEWVERWNLIVTRS
jgi:putative spermidine/putrescine transport system substrate-binding protein